MGGNKKDIEDLFRGAYDGFDIKPSSRLRRNVRHKLWKADFFSTKPNRLNIVYIGLFIGALASVGWFVNHDFNINKNSKPMVSAEPIENSEIVQKASHTDLALNENNSSELIPEVVESPQEFKALFKPSLKKGCAPLTVSFKNTSVNYASQLWDFGVDNETSKQREPSFTFKKPGVYKVKLTVTNPNGQKDEYTQSIKVDEKPVAAIDVDIQESDISTRKIVFRNNSDQGLNYQWSFGDNSTSSEIAPAHSYSDYKVYNVSLVATNNTGCSDTVKLLNRFIEKNYTLSFPSNFIPNINSPGNNGYYESAGVGSSVFYPTNFGTEKYELHILTPNGIEIFKTNNIKQGWNGYMRGRLAPAGVYSYKSKGVYPNGKEFSFEGKVRLVLKDYY